jgi:hypothetical protein
MFLITKYPTMSYSIVTTFNQSGLDLYGRTMIQAFDQYWPANVDLYAYAENCEISGSSRVHIRDLLTLSPDLVEFKQRHSNNPMANGLVAKDTGIPFKDNSFKWDAVRFSHKVFAVLHAVANCDTDWVIWLDADTKTFAPVPDLFLSEICDPLSMCCYLGRREKYHSECGWVAYNRQHPDLQEFMAQWRDLYMSDKIFDLREFHDSFVFDVLRKKFQTERGTVFHNLSPELPGKGPGHPFIASKLGLYMDHMKGSKRKALGHSLPDDFERNQGLNSTVPYWHQVFGNR